MKSKDVNEDIVQIMIEPYLNHGWEYSYWGKKIVISIDGTELVERKVFIEYVLKEFEAEDYELTAEDIDFPLDNKFLGDDYYAFIYMDKHDGDHVGIVIFHEEEVKRWVKDKANETKKLLDKL